MKYYIKQYFIVFISCNFGIMGAALADPESEQDALELNGSDCIWVHSIRDYTPLDAKHLLIWAGRDKPYLVRLVQQSRDMKTGYAMSVQSRDGQLCPYGGDALIFGMAPAYPVRIRSIDRLTVDQANDILARFGKRPDTEPTTPAPRELKGADVEELD